MLAQAWWWWVEGSLEGYRRLRAAVAAASMGGEPVDCGGRRIMRWGVNEMGDLRDGRERETSAVPRTVVTKKDVGEVVVQSTNSKRRARLHAHGARV